MDIFFKIFSHFTLLMKRKKFPPAKYFSFPCAGTSLRMVNVETGKGIRFHIVEMKFQRRFDKKNEYMLACFKFSNYGEYTEEGREIDIDVITDKGFKKILGIDHQEEKKFLKEIEKLIPDETWEKRLEQIKDWEERSDMFTDGITDNQSDIYGR